jgi:Asp-tRNA(Asn)/Glu-tRNA(Gln) amidotransferase C subunit
MSQLGPAEVARLARLARLDLSPDEADALAPQLDAIAREFDGLRSMALSLPDPGPSPDGLPRDDVPTSHEGRDAILAQVPRLDPSGRVRVERP